MPKEEGKPMDEIKTTDEMNPMEEINTAGEMNPMEEINTADEMNPAEEKKEKKKKGGITAWIYRIVILILLGVMGYSGYNIYKIYSEYSVGTAIYNDFADEVGAGKKTGTDNTRLLNLDWEKLKSENKEICAWIRCKDTPVNYPIVRNLDWTNRDAYIDNYLYRTITGEWNRKGTVFVEYYCENPFKDFLTIVYGHRMGDGSMFNMLLSYFGEKGVDFYKQHPKMEIYTEDQDYDLEIFACAEVYSGDEEIYKTSFLDEDGVEDPAQKEAYLNRVFSINEMQAVADVTISAQDRIVMLSTCTDRLDDYRAVVWGKLTPVERTDS